MKFIDYLRERESKFIKAFGEKTWFEEKVYFVSEIAAMEQEFEDKNLRNLTTSKVVPQFVKVGNCGEMEYDRNNDRFYRAAGNWYIKFKCVNDKLVADRPDMELHEKELIEITEKEWRKGNVQYAFSIND